MRITIFIIYTILVFISCKINKNNEKEFLFYDNGKIQSEYFVNDKGDFDGKFIDYYISGKIRYIAEYRNGTPIGIYRGYDENGNLRHYAISDIIGETMYVIKWDSLGYKIKEEGIVISPSFICIICGKGNTIKKNIPMLINTSPQLSVEFGCKAVLSLQLRTIRSCLCWYLASLSFKRWMRHQKTKVVAHSRCP